MSNQTDNLSDTTTAGQDASSPKHGFVVSTLMSLVNTSGPAGDWLNLLIIGGFLELMRRFFLFVWRGLVNQFWITIVMEEYDESYCESDLSLCHLDTSLISRDSVAWMMLWLSKQPAWTRAKELSISSRSFGVGARAVLVEGEADDNSQRMIRFFPSHDCPTSLWYRNHYVRLSRSEIQDGAFYTKEILTIRLVIPHEFVAGADTEVLGSSLAITRSSTSYCSKQRTPGKPQRKNSSPYIRQTPRTSGG